MIQSGRDLTKLNEGCVLEARPDAKGHWEIGWGHDIPPSPGLQWSQAEADAQFDIDYPVAEIRARNELGKAEWAVLSPQRRAVLADMAYEIGEVGLSRFIHFLAAIRACDWQMAAMELRHSLLYLQVPKRENRNIAILLTGEWPQG